MTRHRVVSVPLAVLSLVLPALVALPAPAVADVLSLSHFQLRPNAYGTALRDRADALPLVKATVTDVMNDLNRRDDDDPAGLGEACEPAAVAGGSTVTIAQSVCFNDGDNATSEWYPQGVTTVADMQSDQQWGDGHQPVLVSWYDHDNNADGMVKGVRVSFMNRDTGAYRHVLLVYPREASGIIDYDSIRVSQDPSSGDYGRALHAGGIVWYGNHLFVADTARGFRVFDVRRIFDLGASGNGTTSGAHLVGYHQGTYYGYGYRYVMPQIGSWTRTSDTGAKCAESDQSPNFSYAGLDRSGTDHLLAGEYCAGGEATNGRVAAWPMAGAFSGGELVLDPAHRWNADAAHRLPVSNVQGAVRFDGRWYLSQSNGLTNAGTLYSTARPASTTGTLQLTGSQSLSIGPEDLSHWPNGTATSPTRGTFWTVGEHPGKRMVYSVIPTS
ncbi:hypothetical protein [Saccharothrix hoggarensis]|uniref:Secreted protein n=1 Tax=Saccharothrix hoggarensis TaxID=913853 RepID=A0ABW3R190_9PSEU